MKSETPERVELTLAQTIKAIVEQLDQMPELIRQAEIQAVAAKGVLDQTEARLIAEGLVQGKNEAERKASLTIQTENEQRKVDGTRVDLHYRQNQFAALRSMARLLAGASDEA